MASTDTVWDCVVIGGGIIGLSTAYHLTKSGCKVLILEQFHLPHTRGSSHGQSRLIRKCHDIDQYTALTKASYDLWRDIEKQSGKQLLVETGLMLLQDGEAVEVKKAAQLMEKHGVDYDVVTGNDIKNKYPMIRYSNDYKGVLDKSASILLADSCLKVLSNLVESYRGVIKDGVQVHNIQPGPMVTILTNKGQYKAKKVIIATGPWSKEILQNLGLNVPLRTMPGRVCYWKVKTPHHLYDAKQFPSILEYTYHDIGYHMMYTVPMYEFPGLVKVVTRGEPPAFYCHPDDRDSQSMHQMIDLLSDYIRQHFPGLETKPSIIEPCMYCMTPDKCAIMDRHPNYSNIIIGTAFSGKGFMLAPVAGQILGDMAMDKRINWDLSIFSLKRFVSLTPSKL